MSEGLGSELMWLCAVDDDGDEDDEDDEDEDEEDDDGDDPAFVGFSEEELAAQDLLYAQDVLSEEDLQTEGTDHRCGASLVTSYGLVVLCQILSHPRFERYDIG